jgi:adenylate cyclase
VHEILDFHDEKSFPKLPEFLQLYRLAMDQYRGQRFKQAVTSFEEAMRLRGDDRVCAIYVERARHYANAPPPGDWDGVWTLTEK